MFDKINYIFIGRITILIILLIVAFNVIFSKNHLEETFEENTEDNFSIYRSVIKLFNEFLGRNPNTSELMQYYKKMKDDKLDEKKVGKVLANSDEYKRTEKIANNLTNNEAANSLNQQQIDTEVIDIYSGLFNKNPDDVTLKYFTKKYMELDYNKEELRKYMMNLPDYKIHNDLIKETNDELLKESNKSMSNLSIDEGTVPPTKKDKKNKQTSNSKDIMDEDAIEVKNGKASYIIQRPNIFNFYGDSENQQDMIDNASKLINSGITESTDSITADNINMQQRNVCKKDANSNTTFCNMSKRKSLAKYEQQRNFDELKYKCKQTKYTNADNMGKLYPEFKWMTPELTQPVCYGAEYSANPLIDQSSLIGTLLSDAENTEVGSILPKFTYKEDATQVCSK